MIQNMGWLIAANILLLGGLAWLVQPWLRRRIEQARREADVLLDQAKREAQKVAREAESQAKEVVSQRTRQVDRDLQKRRSEIDKLENRLRNKERNLTSRLDQVERRENAVTDKERSLATLGESLETRTKSLAHYEAELLSVAEKAASMTADEAKELLLQRIEKQVRHEAATVIRQVEAEMKEQASRKARQIMTLAIQRSAAETVTESTCSVLVLPSEESKGRIIGREGRNIRAFEAATGVNIIIDDTPEAVVLSSFDPLRREIARLSLEKLLQDGRIQPARIEEVVRKTERELLEHLRQEGEQAAYELGLHDLHPEIIKLMGRLKFRTSYGQNILSHSLEVGFLCGMMAAELGADEMAARRAGFLHDIGKALTHEVPGSHALIGADICRKCGESSPIVHAIAAHHNEEEPRTVVAILVQAADALSASRPGARRESLESYVKRLEKLEEIANSFQGVERTYAMQAGRELRIMVEPDQVPDSEAALLAREVSRRIESEVDFPGQIRVTVLRESRFTEYAGSARSKGKEPQHITEGAA